MARRVYELEQNRLHGFGIGMMLWVHLKDPGCDVGEHMHVRGSDLEFDDEAVGNIGNGGKCWFRFLFVSRMMRMGSFYSFEKLWIGQVKTHLVLQFPWKWKFDGDIEFEHGQVKVNCDRLAVAVVVNSRCH
ncbi:hypothetical protein V6N13_058250 [Hibiscus sabdariffa]|uniref:Uncharacterized protein n=1 Tax=Hibiscus sabdariffa TaxID=183260 RepID=A0ABR2GGQ5_9ROSI